MTWRQTACAAVVGAALMAAVGCVAVGGRSETNPPTLGQQLIDLKRAYDTGAITESEFDQAKADLLANPKTVASGK